MNLDYPLNDFLRDFKAWLHLDQTLPPNTPSEFNSAAFRTLLAHKYKDPQILEARFWCLVTTSDWLKSQHGELVSIGILRKSKVTQKTQRMQLVAMALHELVVLKNGQMPTVRDVARIVERLESEESKRLADKTAKE